MRGQSGFPFLPLFAHHYYEIWLFFPDLKSGLRVECPRNFLATFFESGGREIFGTASADWNCRGIEITGLGPSSSAAETEEGRRKKIPAVVTPLSFFFFPPILWGLYSGGRKEGRGRTLAAAARRGKKWGRGEGAKGVNAVSPFFLFFFFQTPPVPKSDSLPN